MAAALPGNRVGVHSAIVTNIAASINLGIGIDHFFVPAVARNAYAISVPRNRGSIDQENERRRIFAFAHKYYDAAVGIVEIDPFKALIGIVQLPERRLGLIDIVQVLNQASQTGVEGVIKQVPVEALIVIPFSPLPKFASHKHELFAGISVHPSKEDPQVGKLLPRIARHFGYE